MTQTHPIRESVALQRQGLLNQLKGPLRALAEQCSRRWTEREGLDRLLLEGLSTLPHGKSAYALDLSGVQISSNAVEGGLVETAFGRDRSMRPYMNEPIPEDGTLLSQAYISILENRPSLTALQKVKSPDGTLLGYLGTDFDLRDLSLTGTLYEEPRQWQQLKGDLSIRNGVFHQKRLESGMDQSIHTVLGVVEELITTRGVHHVILHFSSNRAVIWLTADPYAYRLLDLDALTDPDICLAYPKRAYPQNALVPQQEVRRILDSFQTLRLSDETLYLRSGTLNLFNGVVGLTFSCDGTHYLPFNEFLQSDHAFWSEVESTETSPVKRPALCG